MIGPVYPYKGGIAHYTGLMCRNLQKKYDVKMISYKMQYPKILFRKEQKDYTNDAFKLEDTQYLLNTANPFNWIKSAVEINKLKPDLVIIQWWHPYFSPCYLSLVKRLHDTKILFLCHNVFPHERFPLDKKLTRSVLKRGNYFIVHSKMDAEDLISIKPDASFRINAMPSFNVFKFENLSTAAAREKLGIGKNEKVLLFFGFVREYKGLKYLIQAMPKITEQLKDIRLLIAGDFGKNKEEYIALIKETGKADKINIYDGYIPDKEVEKFFAASDLSVLPYISATQSAVAQLSFGFNKPVIVTNVGGLPEVVADGQTGYVLPSKDPGAIADAVVRFYTECKAEQFEKNVIEEAYKFSWDRMTEAVEELWTE
jgi:Glycosyltransferase